MKIKHQLTFLTLGFSLIIIFMFIATLIVTGKQKHDGLLINLAGRQRMLSQRMAKDIQAFAVQRTPQHAEDLQNTARVFDMTLMALKNSGRAPLTLNLDTTAYKECPKPGPAIRNQLEKVSAIWAPFSRHIEQVLESNGSQQESFAWIQNNNLRLLKEMNTAVVMMQAQSEKKVTTLINLQIAGILAGILIAVLSTRIVFQTIRRLAKVQIFADNLGAGDLNTRSGLKKNDELGGIGKALDRMAENMNSMIGSIIEDAGTLNRSSEALSAISGEMAGSLSEVTDRSHSVATAAEQMSANMNSVAAAVEETSTNVEQVAGSADQMMTTIGQISKNTEEARTISRDAVTQAEASSQRINRLGDAADEIGKVTEAINEISEQTNLLALNATIEAARAGEAGKGFAVVANEIKALAKQTAEATEDIRQKVAMIQDSTSETVREIQQITGVVNNVDEIVGEIAGAVEKQSVTTSEIAESVHQASLGIREVNENVAHASVSAGEVAGDIGDVNARTVDINNNGNEVRGHSKNMSNLAAKLNDSVSRFSI